MNTTSTTYRITSSAGIDLGTFAKGELLTVKAVVDANPGASVKAVVDYTPCATHPAFEATNCPTCGTAGVIA